MPKFQTVNLDALIPREDFSVKADAMAKSGKDPTISISHLAGGFGVFASSLRKPDFQRETADWTPQKIVDLVRAFVDGELIPAIILWKGGGYNFVIDGAHRLSAVLSWVYDDYGDRSRSLSYFGEVIPPEQIRAAKKTRILIEKEIGHFSQYEAGLKERSNVDASIRRRLDNLSSHPMVAQWVETQDPRVAEDSFFKINEAATAIDNVEKRIIKTRHSALAIASRSIARSGRGHKYWDHFVSKDVEKEIESLSEEIYSSLFNPPMDEGPVQTGDLPIAGKGYHVLPFIYDFVNRSNGKEAAESSAKVTQKSINELPPDEDGTATIGYLKGVQRQLSHIVGKQPRSHGLHPLVYFWNRSGDFTSSAFFATLDFMEEIRATRRERASVEARRDLEDYIISHKEHVMRIPHKLGSGNRSIPWIAKYYKFVFDAVLAGKSVDEIDKLLEDDKSFGFLVDGHNGQARFTENVGGKAFSMSTKSAAFIMPFLQNGLRCEICRGLLHKKSIHIHHRELRSLGGAADMSNAGLTHPYCNSITQS